MSYIGDFSLGSTFDLKFTTVNNSSVPTTLAGSPVISAYPDNSTTELTAGITLSVDFDARTGMHNVRVVATSGNGYAAGVNYSVVITTGTVSGTSVVGYVVGQFSIEARSAVRPTTAGRTLTIESDGMAHADVKEWLGTVPLALSSQQVQAVVPVTQKVDVETIKTNPVVNAGTLTFPAGATLASTANITAGTITTVTNLTNAPTSGDLTATMKASVNAEADTAISDAALATAANLATVAGYIDTEVAAILADTAAILIDTAEIGVAGAGLTGIDKTGYGLSSAERNSTADAILSRSASNTEATAAEHTLCTLILANLENSISGTTLTIKRTDGSTTHYTKTLTTDVDAVPIVGIN